MKQIESWIEFDADEAETLCDQLSDRDDFWELIRQAMQGKMGATELGYEIKRLAEQLHERNEEIRRENRGDREWNQEDRAYA